MSFSPVRVPLKPELASPGVLLVWAETEGSQGMFGGKRGRGSKDQGPCRIFRKAWEMGGNKENVRRMSADDSRNRTWKGRTEMGCGATLGSNASCSTP